MKFIALFISIFVVVGTTFAQSLSDKVVIDKIDQILYYDCRFCVEAGNAASEKMVPMQLQIGAHVSKFCSNTKADMDSLLVAHEQLPVERAVGIILPQLQNMRSHSYAGYYVFKHYPEHGKIQFLNHHSDNDYIVEEDIQFDWQIHPERDTIIIDLRCLMATTSYGGRDYVAWFAPDIPISDGPYKFSGLPGIIVRIADTENEHIFELQGARYNVNQPMYYSTTPSIQLSPQKYVNIFYESISKEARMVEEFLTEPNPELVARVARNSKKKNNFIERY